MSLTRAKTAKSLGSAVLIWLVGFIWGSVVFMTPPLKNVSPVPYISNNPTISFPILVAWLPLSFILARSYLKTVPDSASEGFRLGLTFSTVNLILDLLILVLLLKAGIRYFASLTVWMGYALLLLVPWLTGRHLRATGKS